LARVITQVVRAGSDVPQPGGISLALANGQLAG
jgi:hypothetical protein